ETPGRGTTNCSMRNAGATPVPTMTTREYFAAASRFAAASGHLRSGHESSSQVETTHDSASRQAMNWSITWGSHDAVEWITTSAACSNTFLASAEIFTPQGASGAPSTSPKSRPALAGSVSIAPQMSIARFSRISRAMEAPIGPTPYWMARIFFFTRLSPKFPAARSHAANLATKGNLYDSGIRKVRQRKTRCAGFTVFWEVGTRFGNRSPSNVVALYMSSRPR